MAEHDPSAIGSPEPGHYGAAERGTTLQPVTFAAAWNVQGDVERPSFVASVRELFDIALPAMPNRAERSDESTALWLGPSSWLLIANGASPLDRFSRFEDRRDALNAQGGALFDLTASRVAWRIGGAHAATVLNKGCPLDFDAGVFPSRSCAQSMFGHINALYFKDDAGSLTVMVARSFARDAWHFLCASAAQYGYDVLAPAPFG